MGRDHSLAETRLQLALDAGAMGTWTSDLTTGLQVWDRRQFELFGLPHDTVPTREAFLALVLPEDRALVEWSGRDLAPRARHESQFRIRRPDGQIRWLASSSITRSDAAGKALELVGINWDITDQKRYELELFEAGRRLSLATTAAEIGIWDWNVETGEFFYSERARNIYGFTPDEVITYEILRQRTHPMDYAVIEPLLSRALDPTIRAQETYRYRITRADTGEERWLLAHGGALFSQGETQPRALRYTGTLQDITDDVRLEQNLRDEQARLQLALSASELALWELDVATSAVTHSVSLNRLYGLPDDDTPSLAKLQSYYAPGERERAMAESAAAMERGETSIRIELKHVWPDGKVKWIAVRAQVIMDRGQPVRVIGVAMDVTERRRWEETLVVTAGELQHRVKNTLAVVQSLATLSFRSAASHQEAMEAFQGRLNALGAATELVTRDNWITVPIAELVAEIVAPFNAGKRFQMSGTATSIDSRDASNLSMGLHELCTNAVKYGALSRDTGRVLIDWHVERDVVVLRWKEEGGPPVAKPARSGFGSRLLQSGVFAASGGAVEMSFEPDGLSATLSVRVGV